MKIRDVGDRGGTFFATSPPMEWATKMMGFLVTFYVSVL